MPTKANRKSLHRRMGIRRVRCQSGLMGWRTRLQENYNGSVELWKSFSNIYGLAERLGYADFEEAWQANPVIEGSPTPSDFRKVRD